MTDPIPPTPSSETAATSASVPTGVGATGPGPTTGPGARTWILTVLVVALVAGGVVFLVGRTGSDSTVPANGPAQGAGRGPGVRGTIASIDGPRLTVDQTDGTVTKVVTDSSTSVSLTRATTLAGISVGDQVVVVGTVTGASIVADRILDQGNAADLAAQRQQQGQQGQQEQPGQQGQPGQQARPNGAPGGAAPGGAGGGFTMGEVTTVSPSSLTIRATDGTVLTVTTSATATIVRMVTGTVSDLNVGDTVDIRGAMGSDGTVTARTITVGDGALGGVGGPGGGAVGPDPQGAGPGGGRPGPN